MCTVDSEKPFSQEGTCTYLSTYVTTLTRPKNAGLSVSLTRDLVLPNINPTQKQPLQISDTLASVSFRGPEYIIQPGVEGIANLVFDVPEMARSVRGGVRQGGSGYAKHHAAALFEVRCVVSVKLTMGIGRYGLSPRN